MKGFVQIIKNQQFSENKKTQLEARRGTIYLDPLCYYSLLNKKLL